MYSWPVINRMLLMLKIRKFAPVFLLLAAFAALALVLGGEYLHDFLHHHATDLSAEQCPWHQFLVQIFLACVVFLCGLRLKSRGSQPREVLVCIIKSFLVVLSSRAPPACIR